MLVHRRRHILLGSDAERGNAGVRLPGLSISVTWMSGRQRFQSSLLNQNATQRGGFSNNVTLQLSGRMDVELADKRFSLCENEVLASHHEGWRERWDNGFCALVVEWDDRWDAASKTAEFGKFPRAAMSRVRSFALDLQHGCLRGPAVVHRTHALLHLLRAHGLTLPAPALDQLQIPSPLGAQSLLDAVSQALSSLSTNPQLVDLADTLGTSERHIRRRFASLGEWLPPLSREAGWQRLVRLLRTSVGVSFVTLPNVSLDAVAASVGYGSARAMLRAWDDVGLPPPSVVRHST